MSFTRKLAAGGAATAMVATIGITALTAEAAGPGSYVDVYPNGCESIRWVYQEGDGDGSNPVEPSMVDDLGRVYDFDPGEATNVTPGQRTLVYSSLINGTRYDTSVDVAIVEACEGETPPGLDYVTADQNEDGDWAINAPRLEFSLDQESRSHLQFPDSAEPERQLPLEPEDPTIVGFDPGGVWNLYYDFDTTEGLDVRLVQAGEVIRTENPGPEPTVDPTTEPTVEPTAEPTKEPTTPAPPTTTPPTTTAPPTTTNPPTTTPPGNTFVPKQPYQVPGYYRDANGREWNTTCEKYSQTTRCETDIKAKQVTKVNGRYVHKEGWFFNNLTYLPLMKRSQWADNHLGYTNAWTSKDGRKWRTECDTPKTGRGGCRSFIYATVIESSPKAGGGYTYRKVNKWIFNNMVAFMPN